MNVRLTQDQKIKVLNSQDVWRVMQQVLLRESKISRNQEHFWVIGLDTKNKIQFIELIGLGTTNRVNANPPDIFRMAIYKLAVRIILVHNHPSGSLNPSKEDRVLTERMLKVGKVINIEVIDHLIISAEAYASFVDLGILDELKQSGLYEMVDKVRSELTDWKLGFEKEQVIKENSLEMAKKLRQEGMDDALIKRVTGLSAEALEKL